MVFKCCSDLTFYFNIVRRSLTIILNCTTLLPHLHVFFTNKLHIVQVPSVIQIVRKKMKKKYHNVGTIPKSNRKIVETARNVCT